MPNYPVYIKGTLIVSGVAVSVVLISILRQPRSSSHNPWTLFKHYCFNLKTYLRGWNTYNQIMLDCEKFNEIQEDILMERIELFKSTAYGTDNNLSAITTVQEFLNRHPITTYENYRAYMQRIDKGEENVLMKGSPSGIFKSAGTESVRLFPYTKRSKNLTRQHLDAIYYCSVRDFPDLWSLTKALRLISCEYVSYCSSGVPVSLVTSSPWYYEPYINTVVSPRPAYDILSGPGFLYVHYLFALREKNLQRIDTVLASGLFFSMVFLEANWKYLVEDIRKGTLTFKYEITEDVRAALQPYLRADPDRALELENEMSRGTKNMAKRIWPDLAMITAVSSGSMQLYENLINDRYARDVKLYSSAYLASEGLIGINLWPTSNEKEYLLLPRCLFYEFIPVEDAYSATPRVIQANQVTEGGIYVIVITNSDCLFRYRLGDVIKVVRFLHEAPIITFLYKENQTLNLCGERTTEDVTYGAITDALANTGCKTINYCYAESSLLDDSGASPFYIVFLELDRGTSVSALVNKVDIYITNNNPLYKQWRNKKNILPPKVCLLKPGTFNEFREYILSIHGSSTIHMRMPRVLRSAYHAQFLVERRLDDTIYK